MARIGGDEFAVLVEGLNATWDAIAAARRLLAATDAPIRVQDTDLRIGLSVGIAVDGGTRRADEMLRDADIALYEAKSLGKRRWSLHRTTMTVRAQARLQLGADLSQAVDAGDIQVVYQPTHELAGGGLVGAEALARSAPSAASQTDASTWSCASVSTSPPGSCMIRRCTTVSRPASPVTPSPPTDSSSS